MLFISFLIFSCGSKYDITKEEFVHVTYKFYDEAKGYYINEEVFADMYIWFKDNTVVEEIKTVEVNTDTNGVTTRKTPVAYYLFIDRDSKVCYHYSSFSDTAKIIDKYELPDTAEIKGAGGWSFYKNNDLDIVDSLRTLTDTFINRSDMNRKIQTGR